jgi:orotidine-5'-phosphate decarboxylase
LISKWPDIPNTVVSEVEAARDLSISMATLQTLGGEKMRRAAAAAGSALALVASRSSPLMIRPDTARVGRESVDLAAEAERQSGTAIRAGLRGLVCASSEAGLIRRRLVGLPWVVSPGIRRPGDTSGDQVRTATPEAVVRAGATHLVVGRPVLTGSDPLAVYRELAEAAV